MIIDPKFNKNVIAPYAAKKAGVYDDKGNLKGYITLNTFKPIYNKRLYRFGILSDVHHCDTETSIYDSDKTAAREDFRHALKFFDKKESVSFTCIAGDLSISQEKDIEEYTQNIKETSPNTPVFCCKGNHDGQWSQKNKYTEYWRDHTFPVNIFPNLSYSRYNINYQYDRLFNVEYNPNLFICKKGADSNYYNITEYKTNQEYIRGKYGVKINEDNGFIEMYGYDYDESYYNEQLGGNYKQDWTSKYVNCFLPKNNNLEPDTTYYVVLEVSKIVTTGQVYLVLSSGPSEGGSNINQFTSTTKILLSDLNKSLSNNGIIKFELKTKSDLTSEDIKYSLRTYLQFDDPDGCYGSIKFRIGIYKYDVNIEKYDYESNYNTKYINSNSDTNNYYFINRISKDVFIFLSMSKGINKQPYAYSDLIWLNKVLDKFRDQRCFVFSHLFIPDAAGNLGYTTYKEQGKKNAFYPKSNWLTNTCLDMIKDLNKYYKNSIWFSGHSHWKWYLDKYETNANITNIDENGELTAWNVHIPSCAYPIDSIYNTLDLGLGSNRVERYEESEGGIVDVYDDYIDIRGISFKNGEKFIIWKIKEYINASEFSNFSGNPSNPTVVQDGDYVNITFSEPNQKLYVKNYSFNPEKYNEQYAVLLVEDVIYDSATPIEYLQPNYVGFYDGYNYAIKSFWRVDVQSGGVCFGMSSSYNSKGGGTPVSINNPLTIKLKAKLVFKDIINESEYDDLYLSNATYRIKKYNNIIESNPNMLLNKYIYHNNYINSFMLDDSLFNELGPNIKVQEINKDVDIPYVEIQFNNDNELLGNSENKILFKCISDDGVVLSNYFDEATHVILHIDYLELFDENNNQIELTDKEKTYFGFKDEYSTYYTLNNRDILPLVEYEFTNIKGETLKRKGIKFGKSAGYTGRDNITVKLRFNLKFIKI